jgi:hypothetical protein
MSLVWGLPNDFLVLIDDHAIKAYRSGINAHEIPI